MTATALDVIPARRGKAIGVREGQRLKVVNTHGSQVLDTWAFREGDMAEYLSMEHTRSVNSRWLVTVGTRLVSTRRRTLLDVIADTSPGLHDALLPACSAEIYRELEIQLKRTAQIQAELDNVRETLRRHTDASQ